MLTKCWWRYGQNIVCNKCNPLTLIDTKGTYALQGGSFLADAPFPKSPYDNVKMVVHFDIINLMGNYMVVNEFKNPYEK